MHRQQDTTLDYRRACWGVAGDDAAQGEPVGGADGLMGPTHGEFGEYARPLREVPPADADWSEVAAFALTFDGYAALGKACGDLANDVRRRWDSASELPGNLSHLRGSLFFEQRRFRHFGSEPTGADRAYIAALLDAIRAAYLDQQPEG